MDSTGLEYCSVTGFYSYGNEPERNFLTAETETGVEVSIREVLALIAAPKPTIHTEIFCGFLSLRRKIAGCYFKLGRNCCLPNSFQFVVHPHHLTACNLSC
jgi:hypothetical protein